MAACYWKEEGELQTNSNRQSFTSPCGPVNDTNQVVPCCVNGDYCMSDGFCYYTHSLSGGSGYYVASCTDPTYLSPVCQNRCVNDKSLDAVYNPSSSLWACCTNATSDVQCYAPFDETFDGPPPQSLSTLFYIPATGFSPTSQQITATSTSSSSTSLAASTTSVITPPTTSSGAPKSQDSGLSTGTKAGIGVGVGLGVIVIALLLLILLRQRRNFTLGAARPTLAEAHEKPATEDPVTQVPVTKLPVPKVSLAELAN
ncbi:hypothetical protein G7Y89_g5122 [Cudoniella acicularis]|uniref:Uncharacterized protein n=1 Tax=Cudoniella acicularis TaxID=354080 RepID=A0A8H4W3N3_9HELO|nr:hypothetical protein G7Y89_g5122 [Cudoniella acicularis]